MNFCPQHIGDPWYIWGASPSSAPPILWSFCNGHAVICFVSPTWPLIYFQLNTNILASVSQDYLISLGYLSSCCVIGLISLKDPGLILVPKITGKNVSRLPSTRERSSVLSQNGLFQSALFLRIPSWVPINLSSHFVLLTWLYWIDTFSPSEAHNFPY